MHCILHIGTDKTGTKSLQKSFALQRQILLKQDILYPVTGTGAERGKFANRHIGLRFAFEQLKPQDNPKQKLLGLDSHEGIAFYQKHFPERFDDELARYGGVKSVILSDEDLFVSSRAATMEKLREFLLARFTSIEVVVYLRDTHEYLPSAYSQHVKQGGWPDSMNTLRVFCGEAA